MSSKLQPGNLRKEINFKINSLSVNKPAYRPVQMISLGCHAEGACLPHPDHTDPESCLLGHNRRVCFEPPVKNRAVLRKFQRFVRKWCKKNLVPLSPDLDVSFEFWLTLTNYPEWRKQELREAWALIDNIIEKRHFIVNSFIKDETYPEYKNLRGINARTDAFKCAVGPIFKLIEKEVFKSEWFIKKVPVPDRPKYIYERLHSNSRDFYGTDHTSFEGHFSKEFMESCEFYMYDYMSQHLFGGKEFSDLIHNVLGGDNFIVSKWFSYNIRATRMTGEMCTSLGNGFSNLMLLLFVAKESGTDIEGVVEGDDSLFSVRKGTKLKIEIFKELGFNIKIDKFDNVNTASFCGNVFAVGDFYVVTNPLDAILSFGWTQSKYASSKKKVHLQLLRSKSLSMLYEYRGCPLLKNLALYGLRMTTGYRIRTDNLNTYERDLLIEQFDEFNSKGLPIVEIPMNTRLLVEELYGISVENQLKFEEYVDGLNELVPISLELIDTKLHDHTRHYYLFYVMNVKDTKLLNYPNLPDASNVIWNKSYLDRVNLTRTSFIK